MGKPESMVEYYLVREAEAMGALVRKVQWVGRRGAPDRVLFYRGLSVFVELKAAGKKLDRHQEREIARLRAHSIPVFVVDTKDGVDDLLDQLADLL